MKVLARAAAAIVLAATCSSTASPVGEVAASLASSPRMPDEAPPTSTPALARTRTSRSSPRATARLTAVVVRTPTVTEARSYALKLLGRTQYSCLDAIFERESHWRVNALNKRSGAYGIPQALPGSKMASKGSDWRVNPVTQVRWGISYVNGRYGSACAAWRHVQLTGWY